MSYFTVNEYEEVRTLPSPPMTENERLKAENAKLKKELERIDNVVKAIQGQQANPPQQDFYDNGPMGGIHTPPPYSWRDG